MGNEKTWTKRISGKWRTFKMYTCERCGKEFEARADYPQKYCSRECYYESIRTGRTKYPKTCQLCGKEFQGWTPNSQFCSTRCQYLARMGKNHPLYKRGFSMDDGYRKVLSGKGGYVREHRKVVEGIIGRKLKTDEIIHHINVNRSDNRIENLTILTKSEHTLVHHYLRGQGHLSKEEYEAIINKGMERITSGG